MATADQFAAAQGSGGQSGAFTAPVQQANTGSPFGYTGLRGAQDAWAQQYVNAMNAGNANPQDLNRFLDYKAVLPELQGLTIKNNNPPTYTGNDLQSAQKQWYMDYNNAIQSGTNDLSQLDRYNGYAKYLFNGQKATPSQATMQQLSIGALNGDRGAQNYLQAMGLNPLSGADLWNGIDPTKDTTQFGSLENGGINAASDQYMKDNPYSAFTKNQNMGIYNQYNGIIKSNGQLDNNQMSIYNDLVNKWNLKNMTDPYNQNIDQLTKDKQDALTAQDVALNQSMGALDSRNFQNMQTAQQAMTNRGMGDSGFAQEAYNQATMAANQDYQKAFSDAATQKSNLATNYDTAIGNMKTTQLTNQQAQAQQQVANQQAQQKMQSDQDQFLTTQTGYVYIGGKPLISNGQPMTTLDWQKMSETARHDLATESLTQQQNTDTYNLGVMNNATNQAKINSDYNVAVMNNNTANAKIQADLNMKSQQLQLDWANEGLSAQKTQSSIDAAIASAKTAATNADTGAFKAQASAVAAEMQTLKDQMTPYIKNKQPVPADLQTQFNNTLGKYEALIGSMGN